MSLNWTRDGQYLFAIDDENDHEQSVVYDRDMHVLWDRHSYEAGQPAPPAPGAPPPPPPPEPPVIPPLPPIEWRATRGFPEEAAANIVRPRFTREQLQSFLPRGRGPFAFPAPYGGRGIRVTCEEDGDLEPIGYSYWSVINNSANTPHLLVMAGHKDGHPRFFRVDKTSGAVQALGATATLAPYMGTAEGWYFSDQPGAKLYVLDGPRLRRVDPINGSDEIVFDVSEKYPGSHIWQAHSSADDQTHSATLRWRTSQDGADQDLGAIVFRNGELRDFPMAGATWDECQIDKTGRYLFRKEVFVRDGRRRLDNIIMDLEAKTMTWLIDEDGAVGHSDVGAGFVAGEDDQHEPCALVRFDPPFLADNRRLLYYTDRPNWRGGMGHVAVRGQRWLLSNGIGEDLARANELVLGTMDGSLTAVVVCPNLMVLEPGDVPYELQVKACMDPPAEWACWSANPFGRIDFFLAEL